MVEDRNFQSHRDELQRQWSEMTTAQQSATWERFTRDIDEGSAGWNRYHPILWPVYEQGVEVLHGSSD